METIPANLPRGEVRSRPRPAIDPRRFPLCRSSVRAIAAHLAALLPSQDGYVKWDQVDIDSLKLPAGDDMGIVRYVEAERGSRARDRNPTRWRSTLKRDPKPGAWTFRESNDDARYISPPTKLVVLRPSLDAHVAFLPRHLTRPSSSLSSIHT